MTLNVLGKPKNIVEKSTTFIWIILVLLGCLCNVEAKETIVLVQTGAGDTVLSNGLKKHLASQGYGVSSYEAATTIEQQIQNANKVNREKAGAFIALELVASQNEDCFVALPPANKDKNKLLEIDQVPGRHSSDSEVLAYSIAEQFGSKVKRLPLFVFLGIDMPAVFLRIECQKEKMRETYIKVEKGIHGYFNRSEKDENERKSQ